MRSRLGSNSVFSSPGLPVFGNFTTGQDARTSSFGNQYQCFSSVYTSGSSSLATVSGSRKKQCFPQISLHFVRLPSVSVGHGSPAIFTVNLVSLQPCIAQKTQATQLLGSHRCSAESPSSDSAAFVISGVKRFQPRFPRARNSEKLRTTARWSCPPTNGGCSANSANTLCR